jgi:glutathionylspermidine synthase
MAAPRQVETVSSYRQRRRSFFDLHYQRWPGTLNEAYDILDPHVVDPCLLENIRTAAQAVMCVYRKISILLRELPQDYLKALGLPPEVEHLIRAPTPISDMLFARLDFIKTERGIKLLECNFDTPGLIVETFEINRLACEEIARIDPNADARRALSRFLFRAVKSAAQHLEIPLHELSVRICARKAYTRDVDSASYILRLLRKQKSVNSDYVPLEAIQMDNNGLYDPRGRKIDMLIRLYPLYEFCRWGIPHKSEPSCALDHRRLNVLLKQKKLVMMNTPFASALETKAVQALIWKIYDANIYFSQRYRKMIEQYFLKTDFSPLTQAECMVIKPMYGRGGSSILVRDNNGNVLQSGQTSHNDGDMCIYQQYIEPPETTIMTEIGVQTLRMIISAWIINEKYTGICYRAGHGITDASWWMLPICSSS